MTDIPKRGDSVRESLNLVEQMTAEVKRLRASVQENTQETKSLKRQSRIHALAIIGTVVGLFLDLCLSGLFIYQHVQQACTNNRSAAFFSAEQDKVRGQIVGMKQENEGVLAILHAKGQHEVVQGVTDFGDGTHHWISVSQHYLRTIGNLNNC